MNDPHNLLGDLPREAPAPASLKARVTASLRAAGRLETRSPRRWILPASIAAGVTLFVTGLFLGRSVMPAPSNAPSGRQYVLLLYEDAGFHAGTDPQQFVAEYRSWGDVQQRAGHLVGGEKLAYSARLLAAGSADVTVMERDVQTTEGVLSGYFVITAADYDRAVAIARTHPHLRHGGRIAVREIEPT